LDKLSTAFPSLSADLIDGLNQLTRLDLVKQLEEAIVIDVTFDNSADAGYISLKAGRKLNVVEQNIIRSHHGATLSVPCQHCAMLDIDNFGRVTGIEVLGPPAALKADLRARARS